ncbi:MAG: YihY/virulence factor BrkB family protein [Bacteroidia bacterium]
MHWKKWCKQIGDFQLPGFPGVRLGPLLAITWQQLTHPFFTLKANAMAFYFFFSLFPALLTLLTLSSYLPFAELKNALEKTFALILPPTTYQLVFDIVVQELYQKNSPTLLSFSIFLAIYSIWQGMLTMLRAFQKEDQPAPPFWLLWIKALFLGIFLLSVSLLHAIASFITEKQLSTWMGILEEYTFAFLLVKVTKSLGVFLFVSTALEVLYRIAAQRAYKFPYLISPGALVGALLLGAGLGLLRWYFLSVANFSRLYGSIAAIIALMVWFNWMAMILLAGYEINYAFYKRYFRPEPA